MAKIMRDDIIRTPSTWAGVHNSPAADWNLQVQGKARRLSFPREKIVSPINLHKRSCSRPYSGLKLMPSPSKIGTLTDSKFASLKQAVHNINRKRVSTARASVTESATDAVISNRARVNERKPTFDYGHATATDVGVKRDMDLVAALANTATAAVGRLLLKPVVDALYKRGKPSEWFTENFGPVQELGRQVQLDVIEGTIPHDFPAGVFVRNGANPQFGGYSFDSPFGQSAFHLFEGDGMLHATYFAGGSNGVSYNNKYVETEGYKLEKESGKQEYLPAMSVEGSCHFLNPLLNQIRFGTPNKCTSNTSVVYHGGKVLACSEAHLPTEIHLWDLTTAGTYDFGGSWNLPFTAHPKIDPETQEMVVFGFNVEKPHLGFGVYSAEGKLVHKVDVETERCFYVHDIAITPNYNIVFDFPLTCDPQRVIKGESLIKFEHNSYARIGIMPRFGDTKSMKWFDISVGYVFHTINAFESGDEVVVRSCRAPQAVLDIVDHEWLQRAVTPTPLEEAEDPLVDGVLVTNGYEWRVNLRTGTVSERMITDRQLTIEFPIINNAFLGQDNKYFYSVIQDSSHMTKDNPLPKSTGFAKFSFHQQHHQDPSLIKTEVHKVGAHRYVGEPAFVPRPGGTEEDDGWLVTYVHDDTSTESEVLILDAQRFEDPPVARIRLPQRVPYGFHSIFIPF